MRWPWTKRADAAEEAASEAVESFRTAQEARGDAERLAAESNRLRRQNGFGAAITDAIRGGDPC